MKAPPSSAGRSDGREHCGSQGKTKRGDELSGRYLPEHDVKKGSMVLVLSFRSIDYVSTKFVLNCFSRITWRRPEQDENCSQSFVCLHAEGNSNIFLNLVISKVTDTDTPVCGGQDRARHPS